MIDFEVVAFEVNCFPTAPRIENQIFLQKMLIICTKGREKFSKLLDS